MINGDVDFEGIPLKSLIAEFSKSHDFSLIVSISKVKELLLIF